MRIVKAVAKGWLFSLGLFLPVVGHSQDLVLPENTSPEENEIERCVRERLTGSRDQSLAVRWEAHEWCVKKYQWAEGEKHIAHQRLSDAVKNCERSQKRFEDDGLAALIKVIENNPQGPGAPAIRQEQVFDVQKQLANLAAEVEGCTRKVEQEMQAAGAPPALVSKLNRLKSDTHFSRTQAASILAHIKQGKPHPAGLFMSRRQMGRSRAPQVKEDRGQDGLSKF